MGEGRDVLVVEDSADVRDALCLMLRKFGYHVIACENGLDAIRAAEKAEFQFVITDYELPSLDGSQVSRYMRRCFPSAFIIGVSAGERGEDFLQEGSADVFVQKPYSFTEILQLMRRDVEAAERTSITSTA
jgi:CheY-like chemotaxis protein